MTDLNPAQTREIDRLTAIIEARDTMTDPLRAALEAAIEWVAAHDALSLDNPTGPPDDELLERYSEACDDLLAVVSQNRAALVADTARPGLDVEALTEALYRIHSWSVETAKSEARDITAEYARLTEARP